MTRPQKLCCSNTWSRVESGSLLRREVYVWDECKHRFPLAMCEELFLEPMRSFHPRKQVRSSLETHSRKYRHLLPVFWISLYLHHFRGFLRRKWFLKDVELLKHQTRLSAIECIMPDVQWQRTTYRCWQHFFGHFSRQCAALSSAPWTHFWVHWVAPPRM